MSDGDMVGKVAGWYRDPQGERLERYWDGFAWTSFVRDDTLPSSLDPSARPRADAQLLKAQPAGICGWLVLPLIGLILTVASLQHLLWADIVPDLRGNVWRVLTTSSSPVYSGCWAPYLIVTTVLCVVVSLLAVVLLVLFLQRRWSLPWLISRFYMLCLAIALFDFLSLVYLSHRIHMGEYASVQTGGGDLVLTLISTTIWILYFKNSRRVRNTFTK